MYDSLCSKLMTYVYAKQAALAGVLYKIMYNSYEKDESYESTMGN